MKTAFVILLLRSAILASRLVATLFIAKFIGVDAVGEFGLVNGVLSTLPVVAGLGLHYAFNRDLVHQKIEIAIAQIRDRLIVILAAALLLLGVSGSFLVVFTGVRFDYPTIFVTLAVLETLAFEIHMNFISLRHAEFGNVFLFLRVAAWVFPYVALAYVFPVLRDLHIVLLFWLVGMLTAFVVLALHIRSWPLERALREPIDLRWIGGQLRGSMMVYASDISLIGATYLDRFFISLQFGLKDAGVFVFFWSFANGIQLLVNTSLVQPILPQLVDAAKNGNRDAFHSLVKIQFLAVLGSMAAGSVAIYGTTLILLEIMGREELKLYPFLFPLLLVTSTLKAISDLFNYTLYAKKKDRSLVFVNIGSLFTISTFILLGGRIGGMEGVGVALALNALLIMCVRFYLARLWVA